MPVVRLAVVFAKGRSGRLDICVRVPLVEYVSYRGFQRLKRFSAIELVSRVDRDSEGRVRLPDVSDVNQRLYGWVGCEDFSGTVHGRFSRFLPGSYHDARARFTRAALR